MLSVAREGYLRRGFEGVLGRIELGVDDVPGDVDVGPLGGEEMRGQHNAPQNERQRQQDQQLVERRVLRRTVVIGVIHRAMMKAKQIAAAAPAPAGIKSQRNAGGMFNCSLALAFRPRCATATVRRSDCIVARASWFSSSGRSCSDYLRCGEITLDQLRHDTASGNQVDHGNVRHAYHPLRHRIGKRETR